MTRTFMRAAVGWGRLSSVLLGAALLAGLTFVPTSGASASTGWQAIASSHQRAAWRTLDPSSPSGHIVAVMGGAASSGPVGVQHVAVASTPPAKKSKAKAAACLTSAAIRAGHGITVRVTRWDVGLVQLHLAYPTCPGVQLAAAGGQFGFEVGARPEGSARRPNLPFFPQTRVALTAWRSIAGAAGDRTVHIPAVKNQCTQNDVGLLTQGGVASWPARMEHLGARQPQGVAYYVGSGRGCYGAPSESASAHCATDCTGVTSVTFSAATTAPYGATVVTWEDVVTHQAVARLRVVAGRPAHVTVPVADGVRFQAVWSLTFGASTRVTAIGGVVEVRCPPAPDIEMLIRCLCASRTGTFTDHNTSRYTHVVEVRVGQRPAVRIVVEPHTAGTVGPVTWPRGTVVTVLVQSQLDGRNVGRVHTETVHI